MRSKNSGFSVIEISIGAVIIIVLVALGSIGYRALFVPRDDANVSAEDKTTAQRTVQAFYAAYTTSPGKGAELIDQYGTGTLVSASKSGNKMYSPIVCAQNIAPVSTSTPTYKDGHFIVPVTLKFNEPLEFTVEVVKSGDSFKINKVNCPQQEVNKH